MTMVDVNESAPLNDSKQLKCEGNKQATISNSRWVLKKTSNRFRPARDKGKGSIFGLVYVQTRGKDTI